MGAHESTRERLEGTLSKDHDDHIAEKGFHSLSHYNLAHKFVPMLQAIKNLDAIAAVDKGWEKLEKLPAWQMTNVQFCIADGHLTPQKLRCWSRNFRNIKAGLCSEVTW